MGWAGCGRRAGARAGRRAWRRGGLLAAGTAALAVLAAEGWPSRPAPAAAPAEEAKPVWLRVGRPIRVFDLEAPEFGREIAAYEGRRHTGGAGREDILDFRAAEAGFARLVVHRAGPGAEPPGTLFLDLARLSAAAGLAVARSGRVASLNTKFGPVEVADATLADARPSGAGHACLAYRLVAEEPPLRLSGWLCGAAGRPADRAALACFLDRLDLVGSGEDRALRAFFLKAERARTGVCVAPRLFAAGRRTNWLDPDAALPVLKTAGRSGR